LKVVSKRSGAFDRADLGARDEATLYNTVKRGDDKAKTVATGAADFRLRTESVLDPFP